MKQLYVVLVIAAFAVSFLFIASLECVAQSESSDVLKQGLLGAGAGAVGGWASGAKGKNVWKGALAGAGVSVVGGALLDSMSNEHVSTTKEVDSMPSNQESFMNGYKEGYNNGYKQGYVDGLKESHSPEQSQ